VKNNTRQITIVSATSTSTTTTTTTSTTNLLLLLLLSIYRRREVTSTVCVGPVLYKLPQCGVNSPPTVKNE